MPIATSPAAGPAGFVLTSERMSDLFDQPRIAVYECIGHPHPLGEMCPWHTEVFAKRTDQLAAYRAAERHRGLTSRAGSAWSVAAASRRPRQHSERPSETRSSLTGDV